ncbi:dehydrogenase [Tetragenococcus halophilus subsp. flandriensis]|uniref:Gfo/Idh/MocA family protein n=1 Tax=Tetragenococcus halophilus TaxID=51669 RepID=UPI0023E9808D|nr:Gfo/Idh/MocA family oxidoreductase [Tetragenococcus halophilus]GMA08446.1 dehydrogenase [Tetragenococcus halophilus subsp. flandriensis]
MKVGVLGLGNIAQKAYLPVYTQMQDQAEFYFATRNKEVQKKLQNEYHLQHMSTYLDDLLAEGIQACFIHTATKTHYSLVKKCLENGVDVFVDKPLSEDIAEVEELLNLAKKKERILMVGFNRRFAPMIERLNKQKKRMLFLEKNQVFNSEETAFEIFDVFLHLVDTAIYLLDDPVQTFYSDIRETKQYLETALLKLETKQSTAILSMDTKSGSNQENYQVTSEKGTHRLTHLTKYITQKENIEQVETFGDWENTLVKRGFYPMVQAFLTALKTRSTTDLHQENVYDSHKICAEILKQVEKNRMS